MIQEEIFRSWEVRRIYGLTENRLYKIEQEGRLIPHYDEKGKKYYTKQDLKDWSDREREMLEQTISKTLQRAKDNEDKLKAKIVKSLSACYSLIIKSETKNDKLLKAAKNIYEIYLSLTGEE